MKSLSVILLLLGLLPESSQLCLPCRAQAIRIESGTYEDRPHFVIRTPRATYYLDRAGGGLSRMIDREGKDWIGFRMQPWDQYPASAAAAYRGIPNLVFRSEDSGAGHPGHDRCTSEQVAPNKILSSSHSGKWKWEWTFFAGHARLEILEVAGDHPYWFLYEGTPAGRFAPGKQYFGTDAGGPWTQAWDYYAGDKLFGQWQWAYVGDPAVNRVLFLAQQRPDTLPDTFSYLGNSAKGIEAEEGMVVFGFGRKEGAQPQIRRPQVFYLGFCEKKVRHARHHRKVGRWIAGLMEE